MDSVEISGSSVVVTAGEMTLKGAPSGDEFSGTGQYGKAGSFSWAGVRAPELPEPEAPNWGEPLELFNGVDLTGWRPRNPDAENLWTAQDGVLANRGKGTDLITPDSFWNFKLHVEVNCPQGSNSGIYLRGRYEVQVEDNYGEEPHSLRIGGVYGQITPTSNPAKPAGEWQIFDITLLGRWITIDLNGVRIIDNQEIPGITGGALDSAEAEPGPIMIQGDHSSKVYNQEHPSQDVQMQLLFPILNAYHFPGEGGGGLYATITPVNSFRVLLDSYFGAELGLLPDKSYLLESPHGRRQFVDVCESYGFCSP